MFLVSKAQRGLAQAWRTSQYFTDLGIAHAAPAATTGSVALTLSFSLIWYQSQNRQRDVETAGIQRETQHTPVTLFK